MYRTVLHCTVQYIVRWAVKALFSSPLSDGAKRVVSTRDLEHLAQVVVDGSCSKEGVRGPGCIPQTPAHEK